MNGQHYLIKSPHSRSKSLNTATSYKDKNFKLIKKKNLNFHC